LKNKSLASVGWTLRTCRRRQKKGSVKYVPFLLKIDDTSRLGGLGSEAGGVVRKQNRGNGGKNWKLEGEKEWSSIESSSYE